MRIEHTFNVAVPVEQAWDVLLDVAYIAPCMPGAKLTGVDGDSFTGQVAVKLGPVNLTYQGSGRFVSKDAGTRTAVIEASGRDRRGAGTAAASVTATLHPDGDHTRVAVSTELNITGRAAQYGRGMISDVSAKLTDQFADCLSRRLANGRGSTGPAASASGAVASGGAASGASRGAASGGAASGGAASGGAASGAAGGAAGTAGTATPGNGASNGASNGAGGPAPTTVADFDRAGRAAGAGTPGPVSARGGSGTVPGTGSGTASGGHAAGPEGAGSAGPLGGYGAGSGHGTGGHEGGGFDSGRFDGQPDGEPVDLLAVAGVPGWVRTAAPYLAGLVAGLGLAWLASRRRR